MYMSSLLRTLTIRSRALPTNDSVKRFVQMVSYLQNYPELSVLVSTTVVALLKPFSKPIVLEREGQSIQWLRIRSSQSQGQATSLKSCQSRPVVVMDVKVILLHEN
jgi:hypothetical protein